MTGLDFFVDLALTGTVLGLDHTSTLSEVTSVLDVAQTEFSPRSLLCGSGLIEFGWDRGHEGDDWTARWFGAQTHWLGRLVEDGEVEPPLVARYGEFPARLHLDDLLAATAALGHPLQQVPEVDEGCVGYWSPVSDMHVLAVGQEGTDQPDPPGTVLKMLGPQPWWPWHRFTGRELEFAKHARRLMAMTRAERSAWFDAEDPVDDPPEVRRDWWGCLTDMLCRKADGHEQVVDLHRQSAERGVRTVAEAAVAEIGRLAGWPAHPAADGRRTTRCRGGSRTCRLPVTCARTACCATRSTGCARAAAPHRSRPCRRAPALARAAPRPPRGRHDVTTCGGLVSRAGDLAPIRRPSFLLAALPVRPSTVQYEGEPAPCQHKPGSADSGTEFPARDTSALVGPLGHTCAVTGIRRGRGDRHRPRDGGRGPQGG